MTKLKKSNCDKIKRKLWQNSKLKLGKKTQKLKLRQNLKTQIVTKLKNPNCDKTKKI